MAPSVVIAALTDGAGAGGDVADGAAATADSAEADAAASAADAAAAVRGGIGPVLKGQAGVEQAISEYQAVRR